MRINSLNKLPLPAKNMFEAVSSKLVAAGKSDIHAARVALETVKRFYKPVVTVKSVALKQTYDNPHEDNFIDVLLGKPMIDAHGDFYTNEFWKNKPLKPLIGDMEHINIAKANGEFVDHPEEWEGFTPIADSYFYKGDELWAKVELPTHHPFTPTFKKNWESGMYGASVETAFPDEAVEYKFVDDKLVPHIISGEITGFSFTTDPALTTKHKNE